MVNCQLRKLRKYHGKTLCKYNLALSYRDKGTEISKSKSVTMIDPVTGWFEVTQYNDKIAISIANLVETTCMYRYHIPMHITYDQGKEFIGHEFRKSLI